MVADWQEKNPLLKAEWDESNDSLPTDFTYGSGIKVGWICAECKYSWQAAIRKRVQGRGCPRCARERVAKAQTKKIIKGENDLSSTHPDLAREWDTTRNKFNIHEVASWHYTKVYWTCSKGHTWLKSITARANRNYNCPFFSGQRVWTGFNDLSTTHPDLSAEWDIANTIKPSEVSAGSSKIVFWTGKCTHRWKAAVKQRVLGRGCPFCGNRLVLLGFNDLSSRFPSIAEEWDYGKNTKNPDDVTISSSFRANWICAECNFEWSQKVFLRTRRGFGCRQCANGRSYLEEKVIEYLDEIRIPYERNRRPIKTATSYQEIDILIATHNLGIEVQDFSSHSRYSDTEKGRIKSGATITKRGPTYHKNKIKLALEQLNINLIEIWEDEINDGSFKSIINKAIGPHEASRK